MSNQSDNARPPCSCEELAALTVPDSYEALHGAVVELAARLHPPCRLFLYNGLYHEAGESNELLASAGQPDLPPSESVATVIRTIRADRTRETLATLLICGGEPVDPHPDLGCVLQVYKNQRHHIRQATSDKLTGLMNRDLLDYYIQSIYDDIRRGERRAQGAHIESALAFIDVDNFKRINDEYGHLMGDEVLLLVSQLMNKAFRDEDLLFRFGGEEFIVILRHCDREDAHAVLDRYRAKIESYDFPFASRITVSIGFTMIEHIVNYDVLISRADKALYYVKEHGKNACHCYETLVEENKIASHVPQESDVELF